ncbi:MAG: alpha/beta hydrolase [Bacteroidota bacterium]
MPKIIADGRRLYYEYLNSTSVNEQKPLIIFLHEGLGSILQWKDFPEQLCNATGLAALVYDRYGYGRSEAMNQPSSCNYLDHEGRTSFPDFINALGIERKFVLVGHSDGGTIALAYAALHPENVIGVITEAAHVFLEEISLQGIREAVEKYENTNLKELLSKYHGDKTDSIFYRWANTWLSADMRNWDIRKALQTIVAPALIIQGSEDEYGTEAQVDGIIQNINGYKEKFMVRDCGHVPHHQQRALVLSKMAYFITANCL